MQLDRRQTAEELFERGGFFILPLEHEGQEFGIDGSVWAVRRFAGIKFLPPGLHLFIYSAPVSPSSSSASTSAVTSVVPKKRQDPIFGQGITIRRGIFRFVRPGERIVRSYDPALEDVAPPPSRPTTSRAENETNDRGEEREEETVISPEYLQALDPQLAPYPFEKATQWRALTSCITQNTMRRVVGLDARGDARVDAFMASETDEVEGRAAQTRTGAKGKGKMYWGKPRPGDGAEGDGPADVPMDEGANTALSSASASTETADAPGRASVSMDKEKTLRFPVFNLKKSWREGAAGEELSRDSRDKSWLLGHIVRTELDGDPTEVLGEMQLAFVLTTQLHNFSSLEMYRRYISLLSLSRSTLLPPAPSSSSSSPSSPSSSSFSPTSNHIGLPPSQSLPLYAQLLEKVLLPQMEYVREEFFAEDLPDLDGFLLEELSALRLNLRAAARHYASHSSDTTPKEREGGTGAFEQVQRGWGRLTEVCEAKFGWTLGGLDPVDEQGALKNLMERSRSSAKGGRTRYNLLSEPDEEDEYVEDGEDAPVVVEL